MSEKMFLYSEFPADEQDDILSENIYASQLNELDAQLKDDEEQHEQKQEKNMKMNGSTEKTKEQLEIEKSVRAYQDGNKQSFDFIYNAYKPKFDRMAKRFNNEDLVQELGFALFKAVCTYGKQSVAKFNTYFWTCARNHIGSLNIKNSAKKRTSEFGEISINAIVQSPSGDAVTLSDIIEDPDQEKYNDERMFECFLKEKIFVNLSHNDIVTLKMFLQGYTLEEISNVFHVSSPAIHAKLRRLGKNTVGEYFADWFREKYHREPVLKKRIVHRVRRK